MKLVITGGHHSSALPVIKLIQQKFLPVDVEIHWFGHKHSVIGNTEPTLEYEQITALNIKFYDIKAGKFYNTYNLKRLLKIPYGFYQTFFLLKKIKPDIILSFGGYLAVPTVICGYLLKIPSLTHEQTLVTGYANKLIARFTKKVLVSWPNSVKYFNKNKVVYTGLPLRDSIFKVSSNNYIFNNSLPVIYLTAGKTGSKILNDLIGECLLEILQNFNLIHQTGKHSEYNYKNTLEKIYSNLKVKPKGQYYIKESVYDDEIGEVFNKSSIVIARAGAHTCLELLALKKPCILIPIPWVSHNEQYLNAQMLVQAGLGTLLQEQDLNKILLLQSLNQVHNNLKKFTIKDNNLESLIINDAAQRICQEVYSLYKASKKSL